MCGRVVQKTPYGVLVQNFGMDPDEGVDYRPRYNVAPGGPILACRVGAKERLEIVQLRWGLIPSWATDVKVSYRMFNARAETIVEKPAFRAAFRKRRCVIPIDGFYEWQKSGQEKLPYFIRSRDESLLFVAGVWEIWNSPGGDTIESCAVITTAANELISKVHDRMPVIISKEQTASWLDPANTDEQQLVPFLSSRAAEDLIFTRVSSRVNSPKNDDPSCIAGETAA